MHGRFSLRGGGAPLGGLDLLAQPQGEEPEQREQPAEHEHGRHDETHGDGKGLDEPPEPPADRLAQQCRRDKSEQGDTQTGRHGQLGVDVGDCDRHRDGQEDDDRLQREHGGGDPA